MAGLEKATPEFYFLCAIHWLEKSNGDKAYFDFLKSRLDELTWDGSVKSSYARILQRTQADFERRKMETETVLINTERHRVSFLEPAISPPSTNVTSNRTVEPAISPPSTGVTYNQTVEPAISPSSTNVTYNQTVEPAISPPSTNVTYNQTVEPAVSPPTNVISNRTVEPAISPPSVHAPPQKLKEAKQELLGSAHGRAAQDNNPGKMNSDAQSQLEAEMLDITQAMKGAANRMGVTIQKNIAVIDRIGDSVDGSVDTIGRANTDASGLLRSNSLGFIQTMIMLAVSIALFCFMIPFIFATSIIN